jgi:zinc transporter
MLQPAGRGEDLGLICGYRFFADGSSEAIAGMAAGLPAAPDGGFVWLHLALSNASVEPWLRAHAGLDDAFFDALTEGSRSTRIEREGETLFAVMNDVTFDFSFDAGDVASLWASIGHTLVISTRRHPLRSVDRLRTAVNRGARLGSSVTLLDHLLRDQADELQRIVRRSADRLDDIEDAILAGQHKRHDGELASLRRLMVRLQRLLAPEPSALARTLANPPAWVANDDLQRLNRANDEFALVLRDIGSLQERIKLMQDEASARVADENSRSLFTLTMVTVLALPINLLAGLMGMNVGGIPLAESKHGFWAMVAIITTLTAVLAAVVLHLVRRPPR